MFYDKRFIDQHSIDTNVEECGLWAKNNDQNFLAVLILKRTKMYIHI